MQIRKHFLSVNGRKVHYRRAGTGPALVLLHASPVSSRVFEPAMRLFGRQFTCFAFDTPSNGLSDPLPLSDPDMSDYADAQGDTLSALGIENCIAYGRHTGASIAVELARRHPDMVSMVMTDGYPVFSPEQKEAYLSGYLSDLPLEPDGSHLAWIWNRYRDQFIFWPWNKKNTEHRADTDMPDISFLQDGVIALMEAGNGYKQPYRAVFKHDALEALEETSIPVCVAARPGDSLFRKLRDFSDQTWVETMPRDFRSACRRELALMAQHAPKQEAPATPDLKNQTERYIDIGDEQLFVWQRTSQHKDNPLIVLGDVPGSVTWHIDRLESLGAHRTVLAIDPAGCGASDPPKDGDVSLTRQADRIVAVLDRLGVKTCELVTFQGSAGIGLNVALTLGTTCKSLTWIDPFLIVDALRTALAAKTDTISAATDGTHLLKLWAQERDSLIWFPWFQQNRACARPSDALKLDFERLQNRVETLNKHIDHYGALWHAVWSDPFVTQAQDACSKGEISLKIVQTPDALVPPTRLHKPSGLPAPIVAENINTAMERFLPETEEGS